MEGELFKGSQYIYLTEVDDCPSECLASGSAIRDIICIADTDLDPDELLMVEGTLAKNTNLFVNAFFTTMDSVTEYCFQGGTNRAGENISTLIRIVNKGYLSNSERLFHKRNQVETEQGELLEAQYLATYKNGRWLILDKEDREAKLDCESPEVLSRASVVEF